MSLAVKKANRAEGLGKRLWQRFAVIILLRLSAWLQHFPREKILRFGERFGRFAFFVCRYISRRPYQYAHRNLRLTGFPHPDATDAEKDAFIRRVLQSFSKGLMEFLRIPGARNEEMNSYTTAEGMEHYEAALAAGKGVIIVTGHFGNWEHFASFAARQGVPLTVVAREPEDPLFAAWVKNQREAAGYVVLYRGASMREILRILKRGEVIAILPDQNGDDIFVPLLGIPAGTTTGPATLALHTGAAIVPGYCAFQPDGTYHIRLLPAIDTSATGDRKADIARITAEINRFLEDAIRRYPDQWLWLHNRWKSAFDPYNRLRAWRETNGEIPPEIARKWKESTSVHKG